jgi:hypothetical protein
VPITTATVSRASAELENLSALSFQKLMAGGTHHSDNFSGLALRGLAGDMVL